MLSRAVVLLAVVLAACSGDDGGSSATVAFDLDGPLAGDTYWDLPWPSDLRLTAAGTPDVAGFPNKRDLALVNGPLVEAAKRAGWPVMPVTYFRFTAPPPAHALDTVYPATGDADAMLV